MDFDLFIIFACIFEKSGTPEILRFTPDRCAGEGTETSAQRILGFTADSVVLLLRRAIWAGLEEEERMEAEAEAEVCCAATAEDNFTDVVEGIFP